MAALKKRYYPKIAEEVYLATLDMVCRYLLSRKKDSLKKLPFCLQILGH